MNHFANNGMEILKSKKTRNSKPKKKNVELLYKFIEKTKDLKNKYGNINRK